MEWVSSEKPRSNCQNESIDRVSLKCRASKYFVAQIDDRRSHNTVILSRPVRAVVVKLLDGGSRSARFLAASQKILTIGPRAAVSQSVRRLVILHENTAPRQAQQRLRPPNLCLTLTTFEDRSCATTSGFSSQPCRYCNLPAHVIVQDLGARSVLGSIVQEFCNVGAGKDCIVHGC